MHTPRPSFLLVRGIAAMLAASSSALAVDFFFNVPNGDWNAAGSWTPAGPPAGGGGNFAFVNNGGTATITADIPTIQDPFIGRGAGNSGTVDHSAGNHSNVGWVFIGDLGGTGTYNLTGPGNTLGSGNLSTGRIYLGGLRGATPGGNGTMRVNTTGTVTAGSDLSVGTRGATGSLTITAGTVNANTWMIIGETEGGVGGSTGTVVQDGGSVNASATDGNGRFWVGSQEGAVGPASNGSYTINDGNFTARNAIIGKNYTGTFNQNGGNVTLNNTVNDATEHRLGEAAGSTGNYNLTNGTLTLNHNFQIGASGTGNFIQMGGTVNANAGYPVVGRFVGGTGILSISAGSFNQFDAGTQLLIGEEGNGRLNVSSSAAVNVAGSMTLASAATGVGLVDQSGGSVSIANNLDLQGAGVSGTYLLSDGVLAVNGMIDATNGTFVFTGGEVTRSNAGVIDYNGNLTTGDSDATFGLDTDKTFDVSNILNITNGITLDLSGRVIPAYSGGGIDVGSFLLGQDGSIVGTFGPSTTIIEGLQNDAGAVFIPEAQGEAGAFDPSSESVFWVEEDDTTHQVTLQYSVVSVIPEPSVFGLLAASSAALALWRRRRMR